ncbi:hypothetical protein FHG87_014181 [Trinorchestia longiramus]|nr:hypothetical protein FHG87_014181 [Trinorchestia longiramus]
MGPGYEILCREFCASQIISQELSQSKTTEHYPSQGLSQSKTTEHYPSQGLSQSKTTEHYPSQGLSQSKTTEHYPSKEYHSPRLLHYPSQGLSLSQSRTTTDYCIRDNFDLEDWEAPKRLTMTCNSVFPVQFRPFSSLTCVLSPSCDYRSWIYHHHCVAALQLKHGGPAGRSRST